MFGTENRRDGDRGLIAVMAAANTALDGASTRTCVAPRRSARAEIVETPASSRRLVKKIVDLSGGFRVDAVDLFEVADRGALDRPQRAEMTQQGAFARRPD